jgi:hypothetical protein
MRSDSDSMCRMVPCYERYWEDGCQQRRTRMTGDVMWGETEEELDCCCFRRSNRSWLSKQVRCAGQDAESQLSWTNRCQPANHSAG